MAILFNNGASGTLNPPILNGITNINAPTGGDLNLLAPNFFRLNSTYGSLTVAFLSFICNYVSLSSTNLFDINANTAINLNSAVKIKSYTTAQILALTPNLGTIVFNSSLNQFFYYQVNPISGVTLGWYNSTGTIQL